MERGTMEEREPMWDDEYFLKMKCARIIDAFARRAHIALAGALTFFYDSPEYAGLSTFEGELKEVEEDEVVESLLKSYRAREEQERQEEQQEERT